VTNSPNKTVKALSVAVIWLTGASGIASAQAPRNGLVVSAVSVESGFTSVTLPPITLGGILPPDALSEDLITTASMALGWREGDSRSSYSLAIVGNRTQRAKYTKISATGGSVDFGAGRRFHRRWAVSVGVNAFIANSDQLGMQHTQSDGNYGQAALRGYGPAALRGYATPLDLARSVRPKATPDIAQASLFVPISQTLAATKTYGNQLMGDGTSANLSYAPSRRMSIYGGVGYTALRRLASSNEPGVTFDFPPSDLRNGNLGLGYSLSRSQSLTLTISRTISTGGFPDNSWSIYTGYSWAGRGWFTDLTVGVANAKDFGTPVAEGLRVAEATVSSRYDVHYSFSEGYRGRTQSARIRLFRGLSPAQAYLAIWGKDIGVEGYWSWTPVRGNWGAQASINQSRGIGNFLLINTWHADAGLTRSLKPRVRMNVDFLYDRHGSKAFEGFHLTRRAITLGLVWNPDKRIL
jgi:hypothetical protein